MPGETSQPILLCYDGSPDAIHAIEFAGSILPGRRAIVLAVWAPFLPVYGAYPGSLLGGEEPMRSDAERHAGEGCEHARAAGLEATPLVTKGAEGIANAIVEAADHQNAALIVMGTRGTTGLRALLLGSVSHGVAQHAHRPVIVVPSPELAQARTRALRGATAP